MRRRRKSRCARRKLFKVKRICGLGGRSSRHVPRRTFADAADGPGRSAASAPFFIPDGARSEAPQRLDRAARKGRTRRHLNTEKRQSARKIISSRLPFFCCEKIVPRGTSLPDVCGNRLFCFLQNLATAGLRCSKLIFKVLYLPYLGRFFSASAASAHDNTVSSASAQRAGQSSALAVSATATV